MMNETQKTAKRWMVKNGINAMMTRLGWTWLQDVRESVDAANAVLEVVRSREAK